MTGGFLSVTCYGKSSGSLIYDLEEPVYEYVASGQFAVPCPDSRYEYIEGNIYMESSQANVLGPEGSSIAGGIFGYVNESIEVQATSDAAGSVLSTLHNFIPTAETDFGTSRPKITAWVHETDDQYPIHYDPNIDRIRSNYSRAFGEDGWFVTMHEYGHAYMWGGIEEWRTGYYCSPSGTHTMYGEYTVTCAYVEGFADFFSARVAGDSLTSDPSAYSDWDAERNLYRALGDGAIIEGAFSGFLYDLFDDGSELDSEYNTADGDDDSVAYPATYLVEVIQTCSLDGQSKINGTDELVYCLEDSLGAYSASQTYSTEWRNYSTVSVSATKPYGWSGTDIRALWLYNLYDVD